MCALNMAQWHYSDCHFNWPPLGDLTKLNPDNFFLTGEKNPLLSLYEKKAWESKQLTE